MEPASSPDKPAAYAIRVSGRLGPLLRSSLRRAGLAAIEEAPPMSAMTFVVTGTDLVEVAQRFSEQGIKIESIRAVADLDEPDLDEPDLDE